MHYMVVWSVNKYSMQGDRGRQTLVHGAPLRWGIPSLSQLLAFFGYQPAERPELLPLINTTGGKVKGA